MNRQTRIRLKLQEPAFASMTDSEALAALQAKNIIVQRPIATSTIKAYLMPDKWRTISDSTLPSAKNAVDALTLFDTFDITDPAYLAKLTTVLDALITDSLITAADKTTVLSLGDRTESWCDQNGISDLRIGEITEARV